MRFLMLGLVVAGGWLATGRVHGAEPEKIQAAAEKSLALLQKCAPEFFRKSGCISCHNNTVTSMAVAEARSRGVRVDDQLAKENLRVTAVVMKGFRSRLLERFDHPFNSPVVVGYASLGLAADNYPADDTTDAMVLEMAARQTAEGSWTAYGHRPPIEYSRINSTAVAVRAMQLYGPPGQKDQLQQRIVRAREWLIAAQPTANAENAFRLLGLAWSGADKSLVDAEVERLLKQQGEDGGWSQLANLPSDAYATGLTLYALQQGGGITAQHAAYQRGVDYLVKTQQADGSWHVKTRAFPIKPYFESGFPHGPDQWISCQATGMATVALLSTLPATPAAK